MLALALNIYSFEVMDGYLHKFKMNRWAGKKIVMVLTCSYKGTQLQNGWSLPLYFKLKSNKKINQDSYVFLWLGDLRSVPFFFPKRTFIAMSNDSARFAGIPISHTLYSKGDFIDALIPDKKERDYPYVVLVDKRGNVLKLVKIRKVMQSASFVYKFLKNTY